MLFVTFRFGDVDHRDVVRGAVRREEQFFVRREGELPDALADEKILLDLEGLGIDDGDAVRRPQRDEGAGLPSFVMRMPTGWIASVGHARDLELIFLTMARVAGSMTLTVPPTSAETQSDLPSFENSAKRGRASTSTLSMTLCVVVSMKWAMLVVSEVFTSTLPSGLMPMPSGSTPTGTSATIEFFSTSSTVTWLSSSFAM